MDIRKALCISLAGLVLLSTILFQSSSGDELKRYYVFSDSKPLKEKLGMIQDFGKVFSSGLTKDKIENLKKDGIRTEPVSVFNLENLNDTSGVSSKHVVSGIPSSQIPWGIQRVYSDTSITKTSGGNGIKVAVLDTGVYKNHEDLKVRIDDCKDFTGIKVKNTCTDGNGHGTHVSGIISADAGNKKTGIFGVAPEAMLYAYKVCDDGGFCFGDSVAKAIFVATDNGANIISMSFGGSSMTQFEKEALDYASSKGVLLIAAAGNAGPDLNTIKYPAADAKVIAVAAIDRNDVVSDFSSRGINDGDFIKEESEIEVALPGEAIESTWNNGGYMLMSGTSMAAPHLSGFTAVIWSSSNTDLNMDGRITSLEVRQLIFERALSTDIDLGLHAGVGDDPASGAGLPTLSVH